MANGVRIRPTLKVDWEISEQTRTIVKFYAEHGIHRKRNNKRIVAQLQLSEKMEESKIG